MELIRDKFVAVAINLTHANGRKDADGDFLRAIGGPFTGTGCWLCVTADGRKLGGDLRQALQRWNDLPEAERRPGAVRLGERGPVHTNGEPQPPPGGLILKVYYRNLAREPGGDLRLAELRDFPRGGREYALQAQPGVCWLTEAEWRSLVPADPRKGERFPVPAALREHLFRRYLHPFSAIGDCGGWGPKDVRAGELSLLVEEVSAGRVRMRLEGFARLGEPYDPDLAAKEAKVQRGEAFGVGYEPELYGRLEYDRKAQAFTHFDLVALGDYHGRLGGSAWNVYRPGRQPLGVAFELAGGESPANRISK